MTAISRAPILIDRKDTRTMVKDNAIDLRKPDPFVDGPLRCVTRRSREVVDRDLRVRDKTPFVLPQVSRKPSQP